MAIALLVTLCLLHSIHHIRHITFVPYDVCSQQECTHLLQTVPIQAGLLNWRISFLLHAIKIVMCSFQFEDNH